MGEDGKDSTVVTVISDAPDPDASSTDACLVVINGRDLGKKYQLTKGSTMVGRSSRVDIQIDEDAISRNHAVIEHDDDEFIVRDLESTNGTYVNDRAIREHALRDGDQIKFGSTIFKFLSGSNVESSYHDEIYKLTTTDGLTGAYNKRHFLKQMEREMSRSIRYGRNLGLVMLDIDHFKETNDTYGHLAGDHVLKQVSTKIMDHVRRDDIFARYGGEEFLLLLPEVTKQEAVQTAKKIRALIEETQFSFDDVDIPVTISLGVADLEEYLETMDADDPAHQSQDINCLTFIQLADERLYEAKESGRNCVRG
jgi:diguanylate cyclase (GGDEF)-like protein